MEAEPGDELAVRVSIRLVGWSCAIVIGVLGLLHFAVAVPELAGHAYVDLDEESGIGTWVNSMLLTVPGVLALLHARFLQISGRPWRLVGVFGLTFLAFGVEEVAAFHERASGKLASVAHLGGGIQGGTPIFGVAMAPFVAVAVVYIARELAPRARIRIVGGTIVWFLATFGIEQFEAWNSEGHFTRIASVGTFDHVLTGIQECCEMTGAAILLVGLLYQLHANRRRVVAEVTS